MNLPNVSVIVVSYNTREQLRRCLSAIETGYEIIVVDNASSDGSADMVQAEFPHVRLVRNDTNRGFGAANNQGLEISSGELVLLLNSDAYAAPGAIARLADAFCDTSIVAAGGKLLNPDGSLQLSSANELTLWAVFCEQSLLEKLLPNSPLFSPYWNTRRLQERTSATPQVMGACLMMVPIARFDERYFLYCEDTDLCKRLSKLGQILYVPHAEFTHELGSSSSADRWRSIARYNRGKELYFSIHHGVWAERLCWILDRKGAFWRVLIWLLPTALTLGLWRGARVRLWTFLRVLFAPVAGPARPN